ncbi:unnamed protein product [Dimorphilus gyrociliatus]|uniref:Glycosyltransferase family 92 protein n=1 Tax=Dimorphilus gyrociliatus TaxID=2664684 RepID=A0A7I8VSV4_9ANNE|nr:unnamed protein product [Dimorphilus gyrociliatus]
MHPVKNIDLFLHGAFLDERYSSNIIRIFGVQRTESLYLGVKYYCVIDTSRGQMKIRGKKYLVDEWPEHGKAKAVQIECNVTEAVDTMRLEMITRSKKIYEVFLPVERASEPNPSVGQQDLAVCVKNMNGAFPIERTVEWIETLKAAGVQHFYIYDSGLDSSSRYVFDYYSDLVEVTNFPYSSALLRLSNIRYKIDSVERYSLLQHIYLISFNDCLYRHYKQYKYLMIIDLDEMILPTKGLSIVRIVQDLAKNYKRNTGFTFLTAWHFEDMGMVQGITSQLYFQRFSKSSPPLDNQPKSIICTRNAELIQWHAVSKPANRNLKISWQEHGYTHHFRGKCSSKFNKKTCNEMLSSYRIDPAISRYKMVIKERVKRTLEQLQLIPNGGN